MEIKLLILSLLIVWLPVNAEVYRWVDEQGNVHFGDKPPASSNAEEVHIREASATVPAANPSSRPDTQHLLQAFREERQKEQEDQRKAAENAEKKQRACDRARNDLSGYERSRAIYNEDENGNRVYLDEQERKNYISDLREQIQQYCD